MKGSLVLPRWVWYASWELKAYLEYEFNSHLWILAYSLKQSLILFSLCCDTIISCILVLSIHAIFPILHKIFASTESTSIQFPKHPSDEARRIAFLNNLSFSHSYSLDSMEVLDSSKLSNCFLAINSSIL